MQEGKTGRAGKADRSGGEQDERIGGRAQAAGEDRKARLAAALRANLRRRKAQDRLRRTQQSGAGEPDEP